MKIKYPSQAAPFIKWAKERQGNTYELGVQLEEIEKLKNAAILKDNFETASRYRQQEVELMEQIEILMTH
jgi:hypothetical protein